MVSVFQTTHSQLATISSWAPVSIVIFISWVTVAHIGAIITLNTDYISAAPPTPRLTFYCMAWPISSMTLSYTLRENWSWPSCVVDRDCAEKAVSYVVAWHSDLGPSGLSWQACSWAHDPNGEGLWCDQALLGRVLYLSFSHV